MRHIIILLVCVIVLAVSSVLQLNNNQLYLFGFKWPHHCFLYRTLGVKCALCGLTRSFCSLAHGRLLMSLKLHHIAPAVFVFICLQIPHRMFWLIAGSNAVSKKLKTINLYSTATLLIAVFVNWIIYLGGRLI
jgi:hypothetical protein